MNSISVTLAVLVFAIQSVEAQTTVSTFSERMEKQKERIEAGVRNGSLTVREGKQLMRQQRAIQNTYSNAMSDGSISTQEQAFLQSKQNLASDRIHLKRHNGVKNEMPVAADIRRLKQDNRIHNGVASGQLTPDEAVRLHQKQVQIRLEEMKAKADGNVSPEERARLNGLQTEASHEIWQEKHDAETKPGVPPAVVTRQPASLPVTQSAPVESTPAGSLEQTATAR